MLIAIFDDRLGPRRADTGQLLQLRFSCGIQIDCCPDRRHAYEAQQQGRIQSFHDVLREESQLPSKNWQ
jgi:hypothetical protein